jgi:hypothetical protein
VCPGEESDWLMSSLYKEINALCKGSGCGGARETQGAQGQLALSKGPERMGNSPP